MIRYVISHELCMYTHTHARTHARTHTHTILFISYKDYPDKPKQVAESDNNSSPPAEVTHH